MPHDIAQGRSLCLDCMVEMRRFELEHAPEIMQRVLPQRVIEALRRLRATDPNQVKEPAVQEQMQRDLQTVREVIPY